MPTSSATGRPNYADWLNVRIPRERDIRSLMPEYMQRGRRFETLRDAKARNFKCIEVLENRGSSIAEALDECDAPTSCCLLPICCVCARLYRIYAASELLRLADAYVGPHEFATIHLDTIAEDRLSEFDLRKAHGRFRKRLDRSGFSGSMVVGNTEAAWLARECCWILHIHALAIGAPLTSWRQLRGKLPDSAGTFPLKVELLRDEVRTLSYVTKFTTYHRPFPRSGRGPSPAYPLPPRRLEELASWLSGYHFQDFAFLYGARRRAGRLVAEV
jgi:hypothetical protein